MKHPDLPNVHSASLTEALHCLLERTRRIVSETTVIFITNVSTGEKTDVTDNGISHSAQYYTESQVEAIAASFASLGFNIMTYTSESTFMTDALGGKFERPPGRRNIVFSSAEGGTGSGRRALVPAFCNLLGIPICNSGPHGCTVARHKFHANAVLRRVGLRVPRTYMYGTNGWIGGRRPHNGSKIIVKPTYESLCIGVDETSVAIVDEHFDFFAGERASRFQQPVVVQEFITGYEIGVPIIEIGKIHALPIVGFQIHADKRIGGVPRTFVDENIDKGLSYFAYDLQSSSQRALLQEEAITAFAALEMSVMGRIDMRVDEDGRGWIFDTNESPPPLADTSYAYSMALAGVSYPDMLAVWIGASMLRYGLLP